MSLWFDVKYAMRLLRKSWGYSLMCASVVALSVGNVVFSYSLVYSQLLKPLPFPSSSSWYSVQLAPKTGAGARASVDDYTYQELTKQNPSIDYLGAFANRGYGEAGKGEAIILSEGEASTALRSVAITPRLFAATQVPPMMGRMFETSDGLPGAAPVAILSFDAWHTYFASDPNVIGRTARMNSAPVQIIGIMPKNFFMFKDFELWVPLPMSSLPGPVNSSSTLSPLINLHKEQSVKAVERQMQETIDGLNSSYPGVYDATRKVELFPAERMFTHFQTPIVLMLALIACAILLLGCVNISMVFLTRLLERSRELALRTAVGASRGRLLGQCLQETLPVVMLGLVFGWVFAAIGVHWAQGIGNYSATTLASGRFPNLLELRPVDLLIAVLAAAVIWLLSTLIPAWSIVKQEAASVLAGSGKGATIRGGSKGAGVLVGLQVIVSALVLVLCGNMVLAVNKEVNRPSGFDSSQLMLTTYPTVFGERYATPTERLRYWEDLSRAIVTRLPGSNVAFITAAPTTPGEVAASVETNQGPGRKSSLTLPMSVVSENYFNLLGLNLSSGRLFDATDNNSSLKVAIVDDKMVARFWPDQNVLGKRIQLNPSGNGDWLTIVGVVSTVTSEPYSASDGVIYRPLGQALPQEFQLLVRLPNGSSDSRESLRAAAFSVDRDLPLHNLQTLDMYLAALNLKWTSLVSTFLGVALITAVLAASGLFGLISRSVVQRTQEVGIRRALGATSWQATSMFRRQGGIYLGVAVAGIVAGTVIMPLMSSVIPNILALVIPVTEGVILLIFIVILFASYLPSRRAVSLEPGDAVRYE